MRPLKSSLRQASLSSVSVFYRTAARQAVMMRHVAISCVIEGPTSVNIALDFWTRPRSTVTFLRRHNAPFLACRPKLHPLLGFLFLCFFNYNYY